MRAFYRQTPPRFICNFNLNQATIKTVRVTFKETWTSIRDLKYGQVIVKKTVGQAFWYWFKYVLSVTLIFVGLAIASLTYFAPQLPKLVAKSVPDIWVSITNGKLSTNATQPLILGDDNFKLVINTKGKESDIDQLQAGILVLEDKLVTKNGSDIQVIKFTDIKDEVKVDKQTVVSWLEGNKILLLAIGLGAILLIATVLLGTYVGWKILVFLIAGLLLWLVAKVTHRQIKYVDGLKLVAYAAVPALIFTFIPGQLGAMLSMGTWVFLSCAWLVKLGVDKPKATS